MCAEQHVIHSAVIQKQRHGACLGKHYRKHWWTSNYLQARDRLSISGTRFGYLLVILIKVNSN